MGAGKPGRQTSKAKPKRQAEAASQGRGRRERSQAPLFPFRLVRTALSRALGTGTVPATKVLSASAPTGYGKTVFLSTLFQHYEQQGTDCRWVGLDERDSSVDRVLTRLEGALFPADIDGDADVLEAIHEGGVPLAARIDALSRRLAELGHPVVVFVDNLNVCQGEQLGDLLEALIYSTTPQACFVFSSTLALPVNLTRAKIEGRLRIVGYADLALSDDDIQKLFGAELCAQLPAGAVVAIQQQTEGWPAAVRLIQIILSGAEDPAAELARFSGADEDLAALLNRQVLEKFDSREQVFLLELSLLRTFSAELAADATGRPDAAAEIEQLIARNLFVIPLDRKRNMYRLHGLFREFLLEEARRQLKPARRQQVLARAADWCESEGLLRDAVDYDLQTSPAAAAETVERVAAVFVRDRGALQPYIEWVEQLKDAGVTCGWETEFWYVWALCFYRRYEVARKQLRRLITRVGAAEQDTPPAANGASLKRRLNLLQIVVDVYTDHLADALAHSAEWLPQQAGDDPFDVATTATAASIALVADYRFAAGRDMMRVAHFSITQAESEYGAGWVALIAAVPLVYEGDFQLAGDQLAQAMDRACGALGENSGIFGTLALLAAKCAVELGRDQDAARLLALGVPKFQTHGVLDTAALGLDAAVKLWRGGEDEAFPLAPLRESAQAYPPRLALMFSCLVIRRLVRLGRLNDALDEAFRAGIPLEGPSARLVFRGIELNAATRDLIEATRIDVDLARGHVRRAATRVAKQAKLAREDGRSARVVELALDEAYISVCSHNRPAAVRQVGRAISQASKRGYVRPFADRAELVAGLVNDTRVKDWGFVLDEEREFFTEICRGLPLTNSALLEQLNELNVVPTLTDTPTARELELLSLVEAGLTNQQVADRLSLSIATVKWHLYNLYTKLGVSNRSGALSRARALNLLSR